jgi:hypothetical protein
MSRGQAGATIHEHEDDAMFTKKPLGGMSCASCEKDIINLYGKKADYLPWNKFPLRDPSERIARVCLNHICNCILGWIRLLKDAVNDQSRHTL